MIDKTNQIALEEIKKAYGEQIEKYEYRVWKESYLAPPPPRSFCSGMTRYRKCFKVTHVKLKDGQRIPVNGNGCLIQCIFIILISLIAILSISCSKTKIPKDFDNETFYRDMVKCMNYTVDALENKSTNNLKKSHKIFSKYTKDNFFEIKEGLNSFEEDVLVNMLSIDTFALNYIKHYYSIGYNAKVFIDLNSIEGESLYKNLQETVMLLEIENKVKLK